jgi:hypothetical protein
MKDEVLFQQFCDCTLPGEEWTHRAHVKVAYLYLCKYPFEEALKKLRESIQKYNASRNVPEGPLQGYNETTTHAFLHIVLVTMQAYGDTFPTTDADSFCDTHPHLLDKHILRLFYSPERRIHPDAKTQFVEPDLTSLPKITQS